MERHEPLGCVSPCVLDDSSAVSRSTSCQPPNGRQQRMDLAQACGQVPVGGDIPYLFSTPKEVSGTLRQCLRPSLERVPSCYGTPTEPALWTYWQVEDEATIMRRAASIKQYCAEQLNKSHNVCGRVGDTLDSKPWKGNWLPSRDTLQEKLETLKRAADSGSKRAIMSTHVGDCRMDGNKTLRNGLMGQLTSAFLSRTILRRHRNGWDGQSWLFHQLESPVRVSFHSSPVQICVIIPGRTTREIPANTCVDRNRDKQVPLQTQHSGRQFHVHAYNDRFVAHSFMREAREWDLSQPLSRLWSLLGQVERLGRGRAQTQHGIRGAHSHVQLEIHHAWQRCKGRCTNLHLQRHPEIGRTDNDSLRLAVERGSSTKRR